MAATQVPKVSLKAGQSGNLHRLLNEVAQSSLLVLKDPIEILPYLSPRKQKCITQCEYNPELNRGPRLKLLELLHPTHIAPDLNFQGLAKSTVCFLIVLLPRFP